jgi:hypothetical protein
MIYGKRLRPRVLKRTLLNVVDILKAGFILADVVIKASRPRGCNFRVQDLGPSRSGTLANGSQGQKCATLEVKHCRGARAKLST